VEILDGEPFAGVRVLEIERPAFRRERAHGPRHGKKRQRACERRDEHPARHP